MSDEGWVPFGSHVDDPVPLELSEVLDACGLPEFERVRSPEPARWVVANKHHLHPRREGGYSCLCGAQPGTARVATEHIIDVFLLEWRGHDAGL